MWKQHQPGNCCRKHATVFSKGLPHESCSNGLVRITLYNLALEKVWQKQEKQLSLLGGCSQSSPGVAEHMKCILCASLTVSLPVLGASKFAALIWTIVRIIQKSKQKLKLWAARRNRRFIFLKMWLLKQLRNIFLLWELTHILWLRDLDKKYRQKSQLTCSACVTSHPLSLACRNFNSTRQSTGNDVVRSVPGPARNRPVPICFFGPCCFAGTSCLCVGSVWGRTKRKENHNVETWLTALAADSEMARSPLLFLH